MAKKPKSDPNRLFRILIYALFSLIAVLFLYFSHRYYVFSKENEILRTDYQNFLRNAKDVLATMKNVSVSSSDGIAGRASPPLGMYSGGSTAGIETAGTDGLRGVARGSSGSVLQRAHSITNTNSNVDSNSKLIAVSGGSSSSSRRTDVVIGMAQNIDPKNFAVFCGSLRRYSGADIVIFANSPLSDLIKEIAKKNTVTMIEYDLSQQPEDRREYHASTLRWTFIYKFFESEATREQYKRVWMVDVRDTFFQADPFVMLSAATPQFLAFKGVESKTIANCGWNGGWVKDCFGQEVLSEIGSGNIICSGVSVGTMDTVWVYLQLMNSIVTGLAAQQQGGSGDGDSYSGIYPSSKFPSCERNGVDQGVHNVLVHQNKIPHLKVWGQREGPVANMQAEIYELRGMEVRNKVGQVFAVAHQYDRNQELQKRLFKEYVYWVDTSDPLIEWKQNSKCDKYEIAPDKDLFKGICDFKTSGGATGPSSCCDVCALESRCKGFVYASGSCFYKVKCVHAKTNFPLLGGYSAFEK